MKAFFMKKLLLAFTIVASAASLHGMEAPKQVSPIMPQVYNYFAMNMDADIAREIFSLQLKTSSVDLVKNPDKFMQFIKTLLNSCDYDLTIKIGKQFFNHTKLSICDIKDRFNVTPLHVAVYTDLMTTKVLIEIAGNNLWTLLTTKLNASYTIPLHWAVEFGCIDTVKLLLDAAGDKARELLTYQNIRGEIPLDLAMERKKNSEEMVTLIMNVAAGKSV